MLTGANVRVGPCCKHPLQLQQLSSAEGGPLSPVGTQPTGMACGPRWRSSQDSLQDPPPQPQSPQEILKHLLPAQMSPIIPSLTSFPASPFPIRSPVGDASTGLAMELAESEEPEGHSQAVPTPDASDGGFILLRGLAPPPGA